MTNNESATVVIVAYKPKPGQEEVLKQLMLDHVLRLAKLGLVTDRKPVIVQAKDGTFIEVFEWLSVEAIAQAHSNPEVHKMWAEFSLACDYAPLNTLAETGEMFAGFTPVN